MLSDRYSDDLERAPAFLKSDTEKLRRFIQQNVRKGDSRDILYTIENGRIRPSKSLAEHLNSLLSGKREFLMIDDQKLVYESALHLEKRVHKEGKQVFLVEGGPGTGKSVVAINLLVELINRQRVAHYVTRNSAPRKVYRTKLTNTMRGNRIDALFKSSGAYHAVDPDSIDALIVDEAHRLNEKSGVFSHLGENQIKEIIDAAGLSVFFIDPDQQVHWKDIGSKEEIERWAHKKGATLHRANLRSQFRCNGSDGFLAWIDNALQIRETENAHAGDLDYDVKVVESPVELRNKIYEKNVEANRARLLAGYCWDWRSKKDPEAYDIEFPEYGFSMRWNLDKDGMLWMIQPNSVHEIGCIHTCQGLELDYVGVIIGPDLVVRDGNIITRPEERSKMDASIKGYKKARKESPEEADAKAEAIIKNTYRTLLSRGIKGCYIWCTDSETNEYFKELIGADNSSREEGEGIEQEDTALPVLDIEDVRPFVNAVPIVNLKAAAGGFSEFQAVEDYQWVELPDYIKPAEGMFVAQVVGESMNRRIPNGAWCLFQGPRGGTRQGKIVLVQHRDIQDLDIGGNFTVKRYESDKKADPDTGWRHQKIRLVPESHDSGYKTMELEDDAVADLRVIGEFKTVLDL